tara:strand:+ start:868 stop:1044 length:177 start_codon:yes stop_codon:yes gene_type:complete
MNDDVALLFWVEGIEGADYTIKIEKPSGEYMKVLIPKDFQGNEDVPYGLNMVCDGHYT